MRPFALSLILFNALAAESTPLVLTPESVNENCTQSWQLTETEGRTLLTFSDLKLSLPSPAAAQVKHCRIAWKPLIPAGCYENSARLEIRGRLVLNSNPPLKPRAQLRLSHDLLGQGDSSAFKSVDIQEGPFQVSIEIPSERFQERWDEVKLVSHFTLYLRQPKEDAAPNVPENPRTAGFLAVDSMELESLRRRDCVRPSDRNDTTRESRLLPGVAR